MAIFEIGPVEMEFLDSEATRIAVPAIGEDDAAVVPEKRGDLRHEISSTPAPSCDVQGIHYLRTRLEAEVKFSVRPESATV